MSTQATGHPRHGDDQHHDQRHADSSSDSQAHAPPPPHNGDTFQPPFEPIHHARPSLPQHPHGSAHAPDSSAPHHATLFAPLTPLAVDHEHDRTPQLSPTTTTTSFLPASASSLPMLSPQPQHMHRSSSNGTNRSAGSDKLEPSSNASQYSGFLPDMFRNAATMPLTLLRSLMPDSALPAPNDEGLSASTLQIPVASLNALYEACKSLEWFSTQASNIESQDRASGSRRNSTPQQPSDDTSPFAYFDYLQVLQKVADVVSGLAASRAIDLVLDLEPKLHGRPTHNQRHYKLGSCTVWADRVALTFLFMSCISRLIHNAPLHSSIVVTSALTAKDEAVMLPSSNSEMKLMILSLGLRLILPNAVPPSPELMAAISGTPASLLLDAFGARLTTEHATTQLPAGPDRAVIDHSISIPVGQLPEPQDALALQQLAHSTSRIVGPDEQELAHFASSLRGKKVALYSTSHSLFARQLSTFLSGVGCDIARVFSDSVDDSAHDRDGVAFVKQAHTAVALASGRPALVSYTSDIDRRAHSAQSPPHHKSASPVQRNDGVQASHSVDTVVDTVVDTAVLDPVTGVPVTFDNSFKPRFAVDSDKQQSASPNHLDPTGSRVVPFSFVIIDDDIVTLQKELLRMRSAVPMLKSALNSKSSSAKTPADERMVLRPTLDHRTKSSPQVNRVVAAHPEVSHSRSFGSLGSVLIQDGNGIDAKRDSVRESVCQTIIFFTSMKSYRLVTDTVQPIIDSASFQGVSSPPEIMVLPKPAGAKRILTALHLAQHKPIVRLPFLPIATSPLSPVTTLQKSWWSSDTSNKHQPEADGIFTLVRTLSAETDTDFDAIVSTPWSAVDRPRTSDVVVAEQLPLTRESLPLAEEPCLQRVSACTNHTHETINDVGIGVASSVCAITPKSGSRCSASRQMARDQSSNLAAAAGADATSTQMYTNSIAPSASSTSPSSCVLQARSHSIGNPMAADALEYFSETAAKMGGSAASGMVIQSPDGRPAGIFFQPSVSGSKPMLSRGISTSSSRRTHHTPSDPTERSEPTPRERHLTNRSNASTNPPTNNTNQSPHTHIACSPTLVNQRLALDNVETLESCVSQLHVPNNAKYPCGSVFSPQVGFHSVLNSSLPPVTTRLGANPSASSPAPNAIVTDVQRVLSKSDVSRASYGDTQVNKQCEPAVVGTSVETESGKTTTETGGGVETTVESCDAVEDGRKHGSRTVCGNKSVTVVANARTSVNAANRLRARQSFGMGTVSSLEGKTKPSAVSQPGFMMGMGFTASVRRGRGPKKTPVREAVLPPIKVLIVEDNPINQRILSMFMGKKKIKYDVANNGREAVEKWKTGGYHLILMDIQLPVMDGIEATKEIRKLERNANIGILPNTPPAASDSRVELRQPSSSSSSSSSLSSSLLGGGGSRLTSKGLVKHGVAKTAAATVGSLVPNSGQVRGGGDEKDVWKEAPGGRGINPFRASVIIVALTASVLSSDRVEALAAGCNDFLNKPVSLPWLNQKILEWGSMMYLMYSGLSSDDVHCESAHGGGGGGGGRMDKAQLHLGFGYGPTEKAKVLASNLHLGDTVVQKKKKKLQTRPLQSQSQSQSQQEPTQQEPTRTKQPTLVGQPPKPTT